jgi:PAS domain S-box-containing protein
MDGSIRVLHVEDEPDFADVAVELLESHDDRIAVETVPDGETGLARLDEARPDCVVSDYDMPGMNGLEFLEAVRAEFPDLPFILFTGRGSESVASEAISAGVTDYLQKDSNTEQYEILSNRIRSAVEKYQTEAQLERRNDLFAKAQEIADVGAWAHDLETDELLWTKYVYKLHDVSTAFDPDIERVLSQYHPEDRPKLRDAVERATTHGEPYDLVVRLTEVDDSPRWVRTVADPQREDGEVVRVRGTVSDITDRKERQQELERYQVFLEHASDIFTHIKPDGTMAYVTKTEPALGRPREEFIKQPLEQFLHPEDKQRALDFFDELIGGSDRQTLQARFKHGDGSWIWIETTGSPIPEWYDVDGVVTINREITERKEREQELQRQNNRLEQFASVVSHDLRNPLNVAQLRLHELDGEAVTEVEQSLNRMEAIIEDVLTLTRQGQTVETTEQVNVTTLARQSWNQVETGDSTFAIEDDVVVDAHPGRCKQLLENLFRNSVEHGLSSTEQADQSSDSGQSGRPDSEGLTIRLGEFEEGFYVEDDGEGIPPTERETVFEVGYTTSETGTGFGLSIVDEIAQAHGWELTVTESTEGGTRFEFATETNEP